MAYRIQLWQQIKAYFSIRIYNLKFSNCNIPTVTICVNLYLFHISLGILSRDYDEDSYMDTFSSKIAVGLIPTKWNLNVREGEYLWKYHYIIRFGPKRYYEDYFSFNLK